jgi:flagellar export protein FliJ
MKAYETLIRLQRWQLDQERRRLGALMRRQDELNAMTAELEELRRDEGRFADGREVAHAYPAYAARVRRDQDRIAREQAEVSGQVAVKQTDVSEAYLALKQIEIVRDKRQAAARQAAARREQERLDEVGLSMHRRREAPARG